MAFCESCGHEISDQAAACPSCGHPARSAVAATSQYADFWTRFAAALIDGIITAAAAYLVRQPFLGGTVVGFLYHWLLIAFWDGQTLGKRLLGIRIARPDGSAVDVGVAAARAGMRIVSGLALLIGFLWAAWDPEKRTWHDMVADTRAFRVTR